MSIPTLPGINAQRITTHRLVTRVLFSGPADGEPVILLHGNLSSATWWEETMIALPDAFRGIAPDQRGFGEANPDSHIDATRGMGDLADDVLALMDTLDIDRAHVVGNSMGGNVVWRLMVDAPDRLISVTLVGPGSPFGFGATKDAQGMPCWPDYAGSGGGLFSRKLVERIKAGDTSTESPFSPRQALRDLVWKPPFIPTREDEMVEALLQVHTGLRDLPGDSVESENWPGFAPGQWGATNALSPKYAEDAAAIIHTTPKPPVLWVRGAHDVGVSDEAMGDIGTLGKLGLIRGWPGGDTFPPQPMISQTRWVLDQYAAQGGIYDEVIMPDAGHVPFIETPETFNAEFHAFLQQHQSSQDTT